MSQKIKAIEKERQETGKVRREREEVLYNVKCSVLDVHVKSKT